MYYTNLYKQRMPGLASHPYVKQRMPGLASHPYVKQRMPGLASHPYVKAKQPGRIARLHIGLLRYFLTLYYYSQPDINSIGFWV